MWNVTAIPAAIRIARREEIDVVLTTSPPSSVHLVGAAVKRATGARWIADLRDSLVAHPHRRAESALVRVKEQGEAQVAKLVARQADAIVCAADAIADETRGFEPRGRVVTIGSINQVRPEPELAVYAALKDAQKNLCLNLARQYAPFGVNLNNLAPGLIATERNRWRRQDEAAWAQIQRAVSPTGRAGTPNDLVGAALLLCSDAGAYIAGADLMVTGGGHLPGYG